MPLALALDLGTTSIAAGAGDAAGRLAAHVQVPNDAAVAGLPPGHAEQNPVRIREIGWEILSRLAAALPEPPQCLGITGQMHGGLIVDTNRELVTNLITWQDRRANLQEPHDAGTYLDTLLSGCSEQALHSTG